MLTSSQNEEEDAPMLRVLFVATVLAAWPLGLAPAAACPFEHERQAMSCAEGTVWDDARQDCVKVTG
ncbi:MAG: hypothetical protein D6811_11130 [Alphaproteobacteria bacterium]|nr:MAG: hypothetical protein D6811_11130 [Alphaproteobacteria bacterium]